MAAEAVAAEQRRPPEADEAAQRRKRARERNRPEERRRQASVETAVLAIGDTGVQMALMQIENWRCGLAAAAEELEKEEVLSVASDHARAMPSGLRTTFRRSGCTLIHVTVAATGGGDTRTLPNMAPWTVAGAVIRWNGTARTARGRCRRPHPCKFPGERRCRAEGPRNPTTL